jgi:hypothetical protein
MANQYIRTLKVQRDGRTWGVHVNGRLVEGGFFNRDAAVAAARWWQRNYREATDENIATAVEQLHAARYPQGCPNSCESCAARLSMADAHGREPMAGILDY